MCSFGIPHKGSKADVVVLFRRRLLFAFDVPAGCEEEGAGSFIVVDRLRRV